MKKLLLLLAILTIMGCGAVNGTDSEAFKTKTDNLNIF